MKKIAIIIFSLFFSLNSASFATNTENCTTNNQVCFADDLMKEVLKDSIETVGKHLIDKYVEKQFKVNSTKQGNANNTEATDTAANTTSDSDSSETETN